MDCTPLLRENCNLYQAEVLKTRCCSVIHHTKSKVRSDKRCLKAQQQSLSANLSEIDGQLQSAGSRLSSLEEQIDDKQADVDALNEELLSLSQTMDEQYDSMKLRIRYMYERSSSDVI